MGHPSIAEILATAGYDWVVIDNEHSAMSFPQIQSLIIAIEGRGIVPLVRLAWVDPIQAKVVMDCGAGGVIVPMVNTRADAELAVKSIKYPPLGFRGTGIARAHGYGPKFDDYVQNANADSLLILQIEHIDAVRNIDEILSVGGIDGMFIGPYDLSASMGIPGQLNHPDMQLAKDQVLEATLKRGLAAGIHLVHPNTAPEDLKQCVKQGYRFIALGTDILFLGDSCRNLNYSARAVLAEMKHG